MSIPKSRTITGTRQQLVSDRGSIQPLEQSEVWIPHQSQSRHGVETPASNQGLLCPAPWPNVQQFVLEGSHPGFPPVLPLFNTVLPPGSWRMPGPKQPRSAFELDPIIRPDSDPYSDEEYGVDPLEPRGLDNSQSLKRSYPFAGDMSSTEVAGLHEVTTRSRGSSEETSRRGLPLVKPQQIQVQIQVFNTDELRRKLLASQNSRKFNAEASRLPDSRNPAKVAMVRRDAVHGSEASAPDLAMPPKSPPLRRGNLIRFSEDEIVVALKKLKLQRRQTIVASLQDFNDLDAIVKYVKGLGYSRCRALLSASRSCEKTNPEASQVLALLFLFTFFLPSDPDEFLDLLPDTWPPAMEKWRAPCLGAWNLERRSTEQRTKMFLQLRTRFNY